MARRLRRLRTSTRRASEPGDGVAQAADGALRSCSALRWRLLPIRHRSPGQRALRLSVSIESPRKWHPDALGKLAPVSLSRIACPAASSSQPPGTPAAGPSPPASSESAAAVRHSRWCRGRCRTVRDQTTGAAPSTPCARTHRPVQSILQPAVDASPARRTPGRRPPTLAVHFEKHGAPRATAWCRRPARAPGSHRARRARGSTACS